MQDVKEQFIELWKESGQEKIFKIRGTSMLPLIRETDCHWRYTHSAD